MKYIYVVKDYRHNHKIVISEKALTFTDLRKANIHDIVELKQIEVIDYDKQIEEKKKIEESAIPF